MKSILRSLQDQAKDYGMSLLVLEGERLTGARSLEAQWEREKDPDSPTLEADREAFMRRFKAPHIQVVIDLDR